MTPLEEHAAKIKAQRQEQARKNLKPFVKGQPTINPGGRPVGSRNRLQGSFMSALANDFDKYGKAALEHARKIDPMGYIKTVASLMPKQFEQTTPLEELSDSELIAAIELIRSKISIGVGTGIGAAPEPHAPKRLPALPETIRVS
jgi:hypothetical protein